MQTKSPLAPPNMIDVGNPPRRLDSSDGDTSLRHLAVAVSLHLKDDRENALKSLAAAEACGGDQGQINSARGHILFELGRFEDAARSYSRLCEIDPNNAEVRFLLGLCFHNLGRYSDALENFRATLRLDGKHLEAQLAAGTCLLHLNRHQEALEAYNAAQALAPESEAALFGQAVALQMDGNSTKRR